MSRTAVVLAGFRVLHLRWSSSHNNRGRSVKQVQATMIYDRGGHTGHGASTHTHDGKRCGVLGRHRRASERAPTPLRPSCTRITAPAKAAPALPPCQATLDAAISGKRPITRQQLRWFSTHQGVSHWFPLSRDAAVKRGCRPRPRRLHRIQRLVDSLL